MLLALPINIKPTAKWLEMTNALAYYDHNNSDKGASLLLVTAEKSFIRADQIWKEGVGETR
jgi:hypothetical protein